MPPPKSPPRSCRTCGKSFRPRVKWQSFCSIPCRSAHHNARRSHIHVWNEIRAEIEADPTLCAAISLAPNPLLPISQFVEFHFKEEGEGDVQE